MKQIMCEFLENYKGDTNDTRIQADGLMGTLIIRK